jgi:catechol 2,3-dioxygenase-like lactoylglutathione lyase family enzyme
MQLPENDGADGVGYGVDYPVFWIDRFHPHGVKQHTAFAAKNRAEVLPCGRPEGGRDRQRPRPAFATPPIYPPGYYTAFVLDPDGNNMEAVFRER